MATLTVFLYALVVIVSLLLIGVILIQPSKSGGMGAAFGGIGESVFGGQMGSHLTRATVIMTAVFFILTLVLAALIGHGWRTDGADRGVQEALVKKLAAEAPAVSGAEKNAAAAPAAPAAPAAAAPVKPAMEKK